jgi:hypothetical protein
MSINKIIELLGSDADLLLNHTCKTISKENIHLPGGDFVDRLFIPGNRSNQVLRSLQSIYNHGRLSGTGYVSILPVDQGIEHSAGASFAPNPMFFDPENIVKLAIEGGCNAVASTFGVLASVSRKYAHKIPFIVKINTPWNIIAPKGVKFLMMPITYPDSHEFENAIGILDPGISCEINFQLWWNVKDGETLLKAGTPMVHLIPLSPELYDVVCRDMTEHDKTWINKQKYLQNFSFRPKRNLIKEFYYKHFG